MIYKVRCKQCQGVATIDTEAKTCDISYARETSPYGPDFPHPSMTQCPLTEGLDLEQLVHDDRVEVL